MKSRNEPSESNSEVLATKKDLAGMQFRAAKDWGCRSTPQDTTYFQVGVTRGLLLCLFFGDPGRTPVLPSPKYLISSSLNPAAHTEDLDPY